MGHSQYLRRETLVNKDIFSKGKIHSLSILYESMAALSKQKEKSQPPTGVGQGEPIAFSTSQYIFFDTQ